MSVQQQACLWPKPGRASVCQLVHHPCPLLCPCRVHHPAINEAAALLQQAVEACGVEPYDEGQRTGQLRYVQLTAVQQRDNGGAALAPAVQLVLVWNSHRGTTQQQQQGNGSSSGSGSSSSSSRLASLADQLWRVGQRRPDGTPLLHSLWANFQPERSNKILGPEWRLLHGPDLAWARLGGADIAFGPGSFMQVRSSAHPLPRACYLFCLCMHMSFIRLRNLPGALQPCSPRCACLPAGQP